MEVVIGLPPLIGDPTIIGWLTVAAYVGAGWLCLAAARRTEYEQSKDRRFWWAVAGVFAFLALNKQMDLQTSLTDAAREAAREGGWYKQRRSYQVAFITAVSVAAIVAFLVAIRHYRGHAPSIWFALGGLAITSTYLFVRAASFHHFDVLLRTALSGFRSSWILELTGIVIVAAAAKSYSPSRTSRRKTRN